MISLKYILKEMELKAAVKPLVDRLSKPQQALKEYGLVLLRSIAHNFKTGGRPDKWTRSVRAKQSGGKTLIDTARLKNSITMDVTDKILTVGTNVIYAAIHDLGGRIKKNVTVSKHWRYMDTAFGKPIKGKKVLVKSHQRKMNLNIPQREFMVVQDSDWRVFKRIFADYLIK